MDCEFRESQDQATVVHSVSCDSDNRSTTCSPCVFNNRRQKAAETSAAAQGGQVKLPGVVLAQLLCKLTHGNQSRATAVQQFYTTYKTMNTFNALFAQFHVSFEMHFDNYSRDLVLFFNK